MIRRWKRGEAKASPTVRDLERGKLMVKSLAEGIEMARTGRNPVWADLLTPLPPAAPEIPLEEYQGKSAASD